MNNTDAVTLPDLEIFAAHWLSDDCTLSVLIDLNGDCRINMTDFQTLAQNWLQVIE